MHFTWGMKCFIIHNFLQEKPGIQPTDTDNLANDKNVHQFGAIPNKNKLDSCVVIIVSFWNNIMCMA